MNNRHKLFIGIFLVFTMLLTACAGDNTVEIDEDLVAELDAKLEEVNQENEMLLEEKEQLEKESEELHELNEELVLHNYSANNTNNSNTANTSSSQNLLDMGLDIMQLIKDKDMAGLSNYVHPSKGLNFTPNVHIVIGRDMVFDVQEVASLAQDTTVYNWGYYLPPPVEVEMLLNFNDYYDDYIYDEDYMDADLIGINTIVNTGDEIDNVHDSFPNSEFLEFMFVGAPHSRGSDWRSLKLVFEEENANRYLVGIVHGQWIDLGSQ